MSVQKYVTASISNPVTGTILSVSSEFSIAQDNTVISLDQKSRIDLLSQAVFNLQKSVTISGSGQFRALEGSKVVIGANADFQVQMSISSTLTIDTGVQMQSTEGVELQDGADMQVGQQSTVRAVSKWTVTRKGRITAAPESVLSFLGSLDLSAESTMSVSSSTVRAQSLQVTSSACMFSGSAISITSTMDATGASIDLAAGTTISVQSRFVVTSCSTIALSGSSSLNLQSIELPVSTITLSDASSAFELTQLATSVSTMTQGAIRGSGLATFRRSLMRMSDSQIAAPISLSNPNTVIAATRRATDLSTWNVLSVCGSEVSSGGLQVAAGAALSLDAACIYGTATYKMAGTASTYTVTATTGVDGSLSVESGGLLVFTNVNSTAGVFSVNGSITMNGGVEIVVSPDSAGTVTLLRWLATSCADMSPSATIDGCDGCNLTTLSSSPAEACYLQLELPYVNSSFAATHTSPAACGSLDAAWFLAQAEAFQPATAPFIIDLQHSCATTRSSTTVFTHVCQGETVATAEALCTSLMNNADLQNKLQDPFTDAQGNDWQYLWFLLLLLLCPLFGAVWWAWRKHRAKKEMPVQDFTWQPHCMTSVETASPYPSPHAPHSPRWDNAIDVDRQMGPSYNPLWHNGIAVDHRIGPCPSLAPGEGATPENTRRGSGRRQSLHGACIHAAPAAIQTPSSTKPRDRPSPSRSTVRSPVPTVSKLRGPSSCPTDITSPSTTAVPGPVPTVSQLRYKERPSANADAVPAPESNPVCPGRQLNGVPPSRPVPRGNGGAHGGTEAARGRAVPTVSQLHYGTHPTSDTDSTPAPVQTSPRLQSKLPSSSSTDTAPAPVSTVSQLQSSGRPSSSRNTGAAPVPPGTNTLPARSSRSTTVTANRLPSAAQTNE